MIRKIFSLLPFALMAFGVTNGQEHQEPCGTLEVNNSYIESAPEIAKYEKQLNEFIAQKVAEMQSGRSRSKGTAFSPEDTLHIPVVVHIVHDYGAEYVDDNEVYDLIDHLNEIYLAQNTDLSQIIAPFQPYIGNARIMFHLATKDPKGRPTIGILRHYSYLSYGGDDQAKFDQWDPSSYLNIWTTNRIGRSPASGQILAYAVFPSSAAQTPYTDGILSGYQFINRDKTIPHEVGHILNLRHTWGNTPVATNCDGDDEVDDTPPTTGHFGGGDPFGASAAANCNSNAVLYDTACTSNLNSLSKILLDPTLAPRVNTEDDRGFDYIPETNLSVVGVTIYPNSIGEEFEITHYENNSVINVFKTKRDTVGLLSLGSSFRVATDITPNIKAGMRLDFGKYVKIDSFTIYPNTIGDPFQVKLLSFNGSTLKEYNGTTTTNSGPQVVPFDAFVAPSTAYQLVMTINPGMKCDTLTPADITTLENSAKPKRRSPGVIEILNYYDTTGSAQDPNYVGRYNYFYNMHIRYDALTTTDSSAQEVTFDGFKANNVGATYSLKLTKNPGVFNDSVGNLPYVSDIPCIIEVENETTNGRYNNLYSLKIKYGYIKNCIDYPDTVNTQNIMDYSNCPIMFTKLQVARMRATLASPVGNRNKLVNDTTHVRTGILKQLGGEYYTPSTRPDLKPIPEFSVEVGTAAGAQRTYYLCNTSNFRFRQRAWRDTITSVSFTFSNGAEKQTVVRSSQAELNTAFENKFSQPGWVDVTVKATGNNTGDSTTEFESVVYAADASKTINPLNGYYMDFEAGDANNPIDEYPIFNYYKNDHKWQVMDNVGYTGSGCISYRNYDDRTGSEIYTGTPRGDRDDFFTPAFDLSGMTNGECRLNFMTSGAFRVTDSRLMQDTLEVHYSTNCGESWIPVARLTKGDLANKGVVAIPYSPLYNGDWQLQSLEIPQNARTGKVFFRFRYLPGGDIINNTAIATRMVPGTGNHFYLDRINISPFPAGVNTLLNDEKSVALAPNPTTGNSELIINSTSTDNANIMVTDITGKVVYSLQHKLNGNINTIQIPASAIKVKGVYMVHVQVGNDKFTEKLVSY